MYIEGLLLKRITEHG